MFEFFLNLSFSYLTYLTFRKLRLVKVFLFLFEVRFFDLNWSLVWNDFLLGLKLNFVHFLFKGFHLIVKYDFLGLIIKVFSDFFDVNFDGFVCSFLHDFKIILIGEGDFVWCKRWGQQMMPGLLGWRCGLTCCGRLWKT